MLVLKGVKAYGRLGVLNVLNRCNGVARRLLFEAGTLGVVNREGRLRDGGKGVLGTL